MDYTFKKSNLLILIMVTCSILYITLKGEFTNILTILLKVNIAWLSMAIICIFLYWIIEAKTLHMMLRTYDKKLSYFNVLKLVLTTQFFNGITPFSTGGQPFQIYVLSKSTKLKLSNITSASLHNFIVYQTVLVIMSTIAICTRYFFHVFPKDTPGLDMLVFIGFLLNIIIISALIIIASSPILTKKILSIIYFVLKYTPLKKKLPGIQLKYNHIVKEFHKDILALMADKYTYYKAIMLNILKLLSFYTVAYFISLAVDFDHISIIQALVASAYVMLITSIVPLPGASGGAEMGFLVFFGSFIIGPQATAIMLLWRFITYYIGLFTGLITFYFGYNTMPSSS